MEEDKIKFYIWPAIIGIIFLLLSFFDWQYSFYTILRIVVTIMAIYYAYYLYETFKKTGFWFWLLVAIAILFNPIIPVHLYDKSIWSVIDVVVAIFFLALIFKFGRKHN